MAALTEATVRPQRFSWLGPAFAFLTWLLTTTAVLLTAESYFFAAIGTCVVTVLVSVSRWTTAGRCGWSSIVATIALLVGWFAFPALDDLREVARGSSCRLAQIALAMHNYNDAHGGLLPTTGSKSPDGKMLISWRVAILPYIEQQDLYNRFHLDEPWDSTHNLTLLPEIPTIYRPNANVVAERFTTLFQVFVGPGAPFGSDAPGIPRTFVDGTSNTILVAEASVGVPWTKPADLVYDPHSPVPSLGKVLREDRVLFRVKQPLHFRVALADGSSRYVKKTISDTTLRAAITCAGGEELGPDW
jgi:hypothetical protein